MGLKKLAGSFKFGMVGWGVKRFKKKTAIGGVVDIVSNNTITLRAELRL